MQVNTQSFVDFSIYGHMTWSTVFEILLVFTLLWFYIKWAMFAGLAAMIAFIPYNIYISSRYNRSETRNIKAKDTRIKMMNEILNGIKVRET
jgi:hypothetical protein